MANQKPRLSEIELRPGMTVELQCQGCRQWFEWTVPDTKAWWDSIPAFHGKKCKERRRRRKAEVEAGVECPFPEKRAYPTQADAEVVRRSLTRQYREPFSIFRCVCGELHIGRVNMRQAGMTSV